MEVLVNIALVVLDQVELNEMLGRLHGDELSEEVGEVHVDGAAGALQSFLVENQP